MKKYLFIFCLIFCAAGVLKAQSSDPPETGLKIGDKVPDVDLPSVLNYSSPSAKLSDFKGKLLIIDFWATWCMPCIRMIPKMDSLQKEFGQQVQFLPVGFQSRKIISSFLEKYQQQNHIHLTLPDVTDDSTLAKLFPHKSLPHFVWIDGNGIVKAITEFQYVDEAHIREFLKDGTITAKLKNDINLPFDRSKPFLINGNGGNGDNLLYHAVFASYKKGIDGSGHYDVYEPGKARRVADINMPVANLFADAFGGDTYWFGRNKRVYLTKDSAQLDSKLRGSAYEDWMDQGHGFSYELIVPPAFALNIFKMMQADLLRFFPQYDVSVQKLPVKCLALMRTSTIDKIRSKGGETITDFDRQRVEIKNNYLIQFTGRLDAMYMQNKSPIVDATNYTNTVDITIDANLSNLDQVNAELKKYDLVLKESVQPVDMLVFKDKVTAPN